jgi:hypothetical protein
MNILKFFWDFIWGVLLIGFAPLAVYFILCFFAKWVLPLKEKETIPSNAVILFGLIAFAATLLTFVMSIRLRLHHRMLPKPIIVFEIILGVFGAFLYFMFFGVVSYSAYGN